MRIVFKYFFDHNQQVMSLTILNQNFYQIADPLNMIQSIRVNSSDISFNNNVIFISEVGLLSITTQQGTVFTYDIIADNDDEQQIYSMTMQSTGLSHSVSSVSEAPTNTDTSQDIDVSIIHSGSSSIYEDYVFWFNSIQFRVLMSDDVIVDSVSFQSTDEIINTGLKTTVSQFGNELVFRMNPVVFNVSQPHEARFKIKSGEVTYSTDTFQIVPRDPSFSECLVDGSMYNQESITESQLSSETISIVLTLRFETWIDDESELRRVLDIFTSAPFNINNDSSFYNEEFIVTNNIGLGSAIDEAAVIKTSEQELTINIGKRIDIQHPERLIVSNILPNSVIRSGREIPVTHPFVQIIYPSPGNLRVTTIDSVNYSEKDFWLSEVVITVEIDDDEWQDTSLLSSSALSLFTNAVKNAFMTDNESWNAMVSNSALTVTTETRESVGLMHIKFPQQSSSTFNISETIEIGFSLPASDDSGFHFLLSGATPPSSFFIINAVQSYISVDTAQIIERDIWNGDTTIAMLFVDDELIASSDVIANHIINSLQSSLGVTNITSETTIVNNTNDTLTITIKQRSPSSFNISDDIDLSLTFPSSLLRNGVDLSSPNILFVHTPVEVNISGIDNLTADFINLGFTISISLLYDTWMPLSDQDPVNMTSRSHWPSGWNTRIRPSLSFSIQTDDPSTLLVTVPPNKGYMVRLSEVIDVFLSAGSTRNNSRLYIQNFTIQGASQAERAHHDYIRNVNSTLSNVSRLKGVMNKIKAHTKTRASAPQTDQDFSLHDTIADRLQKLNTSNAQNPIAVCKPSLLNSVPSGVAHNFMLDTQSTLQQIVTTRTPILSSHKGVPVCLPAIDRSMGKQLFNIVLHTQTSVSLDHNGVSTQLNTDSIVLVIDPSVDTVFISGEEIVDTQII